MTTELLEVRVESILTELAAPADHIERETPPAPLLEVRVESLLTEIAPQSVLTQEKESLVLFEVAVQGPPGPQGPIGPAGGSAFQRQAGEQLSALVAVWEDAAGRVWRASFQDEDQVFVLLGITLSAALAGQQLNVQRTGVIDDSSWSWTTGGRVYLGVSGALTQLPADEGFHVLVGVALSPTRLLLSIQDPVEMALG